jgi:hypothetical protein
MYGYYCSDSRNQSKPRVSCSPEIDPVDLCSLRFFSKYLTTDRRHNCFSEMFKPKEYTNRPMLLVCSKSSVKSHNITKIMRQISLISRKINC